jgi:hypothetical protein
LYSGDEHTEHQHAAPGIREVEKRIIFKDKLFRKMPKIQIQLAILVFHYEFLFEVFGNKNNIYIF